MLRACNIQNGRYRYMKDLLALDTCIPTDNHSPLAHPLSQVVTPVNLEAWEWAMADFPDQRLSSYLLGGFTEGFRIGFNRQKVTLRSSHRNMRSAAEHPEIIDEYLEEEIVSGRILGPLAAPLPRAQVSPMGVIPKKHRANKWRLIFDLSSPKDHSVNDGIDRDASSIHYAGIDEAIAMVQELGRGCLLAKLDLKNAYRTVPVHPDDRPLLTLKHRNATFMEAALPFGLRSAPKIFSATADALLWVMATRGVRYAIHYLDDFLFVGPSGSDSCDADLTTALQTCADLGIPVSPQKIEAPSTVLSFLGLTFDSERGELRLPDDKLQRLRMELVRWLDRRVCIKRDLLSLVGSLQHAAAVVRPGRPFVRHLIDRAKSVRHDHFNLRLHAPSRSDILWWHLFLSRWNGISIIPMVQTQISLTSDASGSWGGGAFWGRQWFQLQWPTSLRSANIATLELIPIVVAVAVWGMNWRLAHVTCHCDNEAVVRVLNKGSAKDPALAQLLRCLAFYLAHYDISLSALHVTGASNTAADALSRNDLMTFFESLSQAPPSPIPTPIPQEVFQLLVLERPDWTSSRWRQLFPTTIPRA